MNGKEKVLELRIPYEIQEHEKSIIAWMFVFNESHPENIKLREQILSEALVTQKSINSIYRNKEYIKYLRSHAPFTNAMEKLRDDFYHYCYIDALVKEAYKHNKDNPLFTIKDIQKLREERRKIVKVPYSDIKNQIDITTLNYSPYFYTAKRTIKKEKNKIVRISLFECYDENIYNSIKNEHFATELIMRNLQTAPTQDVTDHIFSGDTSLVIAHYKDKKWTSSMHLARKYKNLIYEIVWNSIKNDKQFIGKIEYTPEFQDTLWGLYKAAMTYDEKKGTAPAWIKKRIPWFLSDLYKKQSTEALSEERLQKLKYDFQHTNNKDLETFIKSHVKKRILKEKFDSSGGYLDDAIKNKDDKEKLKLKDTLKDNNALSPEEILKQSQEEKKWSMIEQKILEEIQKDHEIKAILKKQQKRKALTPAERKTYQRFKDKLKNKYQNILS